MKKIAFVEAMIDRDITRSVSVTTRVPAGLHGSFQSILQSAFDAARTAENPLNAYNLADRLIEEVVDRVDDLFDDADLTVDVAPLIPVSSAETIARQLDVRHFLPGEVVVILREEDFKRLIANQVSADAEIVSIQERRSA